MVENPRFEIEVDVDGVLADMDGSYYEHVKHIIPNFSEEEHILDWGIPNIKEEYPEAYRIIFALFENPKHIRGLKRYPGVNKFIRDLYKLVTRYNGTICIHTHIFTEECAIERRNWLEDLKQDTNTDFKIDICVGANKGTRSNSLAVIEDNAKNLSLSNSPNKFMINRGHNRNKTSKDVGSYNHFEKFDSVGDELIYRLEVILEKEFGE